MRKKGKWMGVPVVPVPFLILLLSAPQAKRYTAEINGIIAEKTREMREIDAKLSQL